MATLLLTRDARSLRTLARPRWQRRALLSAIFLGALAVAALHTASAPAQRCTDFDPCQPDTASALVGGLLFAAGLAGYLHARTATWLAAAFAVGVIGYDLVHPALASPVWLYGADLGYVGLCLAVGAVGRGPHADTLGWLSGVPRQRPPVPPGLPAVARGYRLAAAAFLLLAVGVAGATWYRQATMAAREDAAERVSAEVVGPVDGYTVRVRLPDDTFRDVAVLSAQDHPPGHRLVLSTDDQGLQQPVSDPYDVTAWLALAVALAGAAVACRARAADRYAGLAALFREPQPVTQVYVRSGWGVVAVYPGDARPGEPAVTELNCLPSDADLPVDRAGSDEDDDRLLLLPTRPALLYGVPLPGHWCTVVVDDEPAVPVDPVPDEATAPSFTEPTPGGGPEPVAAPSPEHPFGPPHPGDLPLRADEVAALGAADLDGNPFQVRAHTPPKAFGYGLAAAVPLLLLVPAAALPAPSAPAAVALAGLVLAGSVTAAWRLLLRTRLAWNRGGVAVVGTVHRGRLSWSEVDRIDRGRYEVTIHTAAGARTVVAATHGTPGRSPEQLANALRYAKERADATVDPPSLASPRAPLGLYLLWLAGTPVLAWLLLAVTSGSP